MLDIIHVEASDGNRRIIVIKCTMFTIPAVITWNFYVLIVFDDNSTHMLDIIHVEASDGNKRIIVIKYTMYTISAVVTWNFYVLALFDDNFF